MAQAIQPIAADGTPQIVYYEQGLGTSGYDKLPGGAFGWGIDQAIQSAYRFLCLNYMAGDEIYLFGFSRGAYTVRSLAGMINCSGLLSRPHICKAPTAYDLYRDRDIKPGHTTAQAFRQQHGERVPITLLGCWDTVGALGVPDMLPFLAIDDWLTAKYRFHDTRLSALIQHALHAVAIDEQRKVFNVTPMQPSQTAMRQTLQQVWFPGGHGCVGGGTLSHQGLSDTALLWMLEAITGLGLHLDYDLTRIQPRLDPNPTIDFSNDPGIYKFTGTGHRQVTASIADLHASVKIRWRDRTDYRPLNLMPFKAALDTLL
jgi:uncharacterized protein (DUF2235 family)